MIIQLQDTVDFGPRFLNFIRSNDLKNTFVPTVLLLLVLKLVEFQPIVVILAVKTAIMSSYYLDAFCGKHGRH